MLATGALLFALLDADVHDDRLLYLGHTSRLFVSLEDRDRAVEVPRIAAAERVRALARGYPRLVDDRARDAIERMAARLPSLTRGRVLDLGCGEGRFLPTGAVGVDIDHARLRAARRRSPLLVRADARRVPFGPATFDTVYAHRMLNDTGDVDGVLAEIARVLRRDGRLLVLTRARPAEGDRLDRANGMERLRGRFERVSMESDPMDQRAALFVAEGPRRP